MTHHRGSAMNASRSIKSDAFAKVDWWMVAASVLTTNKYFGKFPMRASKCSEQAHEAYMETE
jgi:hypothetical protein